MRLEKFKTHCNAKIYLKTTVYFHFEKKRIVKVIVKFSLFVFEKKVHNNYGLTTTFCGQGQLRVLILLFFRKTSIFFFLRFSFDC